MADPRKTFGEVIRSLRRERKLSQEGLAFEAELNRVFIGRLERNEMHPTLPTIFAIAGALKIRASEIIARMER